MNKTEFMEGIHILQNSYNQSFNKEKLQIWWNDFKEINSEEYIKAIAKIKSKNKFMPNIAEIKCEIMDDKKLGDCNLNSCYWYINERMWCEEKNVPYYDITKGPNYPLTPFKS